MTINLHENTFLKKKGELYAALSITLMSELCPTAVLLKTAILNSGAWRRSFTLGVTSPAYTLIRRT